MDFQSFIQKLEKGRRVVHIKSEVDLVHEMAGIAKEFEGGKVLVFDKLKGQKYPLQVGLWWNRDNLAYSFDVEAPELPFLFQRAVKELHNNPVQPEIVDTPISQEVIWEEVDLSKLPVPTLALGDGGPFFDNAVVIAKDPDTGVRNTSIHRLQITGKDRLGILLDQGRHLRDYYERAEARGEPLEITINNGVHPAYYVAAITPSSAAPLDVDELAVASYLLKSPAKLAKGISVDVEVIADAELVIEAEILPYVREPEGPFGEVSGYYASKEDRWVCHVKKVTTRRNPLISTLLPGKEVWNSVGLGAEANIFDTVSKQVKGFKNVYLTHGGSHYGAVIQIDPPFNGLSKTAILATFAAFTPLKMVTAVNSDVDIYDPEEVERALVTRMDPDKDIILVKNAFIHELNPITEDGLGTKIGFDATYSIPQEEKYKKVAFQKVNLDDYEIEYPKET